MKNPRFQKMKQMVLDTLFPVRCISCGIEGFWICERCLSEIDLLDSQFCPDCEKNITDKGTLCVSCRRSGKFPIDLLIAASPYENPILKKLIYNLKYRFVPDISKPLSEILLRSLLKNDLPIPDFIVPVPLHSRRLRWRGFNQSLLLAENISENLAAPLKIRILDVLIRTRHNSPQMKIKKYKERMANLKGVIGIKDGHLDISEKKLLLIDDIATTAATLGECAEILKKSGAKKVYAAVVARQVLPKI